MLDGLARLAAEGRLPQGLDLGAVTVEPPRDPAHGDMATNAAMVLARPARHGAARHRRRPRRDAGRRARHRLGRGGGARLPQPAPRARALVRRHPGGARRRHRLRPLRARRRAPGQRRVRLGEPDRADACRPRPRRGLRRRAGRAPRLRRPRGDARVLHQRRRRPGRRARPLGLRALPRGLRPRAGDRRGALSRRLPDPGRRGAEGEVRRRACSTGRGGLAGRGPRLRHRGDDGDDPRGPGAAPRADGPLLLREVALRHRPDRGGAGVARSARACSTRARSSRRRASCPRTGSRASRRCSARPPTATTPTGR